MVGNVCLASVLSVAVAMTPAAHQQVTAGQVGRMRSVPEPYVGNWVCQAAVAGYNLLLPGSDQSQPLTNKATTPSTVMVQKFSLRPDGTYQTASAGGRYSFDPATDAINWLDGPHKDAFTQTRLGKRADSASKIDFVLNQRRYGCFKPKPRP